jgi:outer membrane cobalamin receptor
VSPRAGVTVSRARASISAFTGGAYAPPSLADQFFHEGVLVRANPSLKPERVRREVEIRAAVRDVDAGPLTVSGEAAAYRADVTGMILWLPNFQFIWSPSNFDVRRTGWELSGGVVARSIGADLHGSLSTSDVTYVGPVLSGQVAYRPRTTGSVTAGATRGGVRLDVMARYVGARRTVAGSALNMLEPYSLTDVKLAIPLTRRAWSIDATLALENLFDRRASMLVDYPFPGRTWTVAFRARR